MKWKEGVSVTGKDKEDYQLQEETTEADMVAAPCRFFGRMSGGKSSFEEELRIHGKLVYTNVGDSMWPLLREGKDLLIIEPAKGRLQKYDVPLYKRGSGQYVLHRILQVREQDYVICGDNRYQREYGITDQNIIGVLTGVVRNGKTISVNDQSYRLYVRLWCDFFPLRAAILWCAGLFRRGKRKLRAARKNDCLKK